MVIGKISSKELSALLSRARDELKREINYVILSPDEFRARIEDKEHFVTSVRLVVYIYLS